MRRRGNKVLLKAAYNVLLKAAYIIGYIKDYKASLNA
jgi:hypothetical protein